MLALTALRTLFPVLVLAAAAPIGRAQVVCEPGVAGVIPCPCANVPSGPGRGCNNSLNTGGAGLLGTGTASISADTLSLTSAGYGTTGLTCSATVLNPLCVLYQGSAVIPGGVPFGDGVLCCGGNVILMNAKPATAGTYRYPEFAPDPPISILSASLGDPLVPGSTRCYFVGYRDSCPTFCVPSFRQKTNSFLVTWLP